MYRVPAGTRGDFKLVVILTEVSADIGETYALQVDKLPFPVSYPDGQEDYFELNPSELQYYATDGININSVISSITPVINKIINSPTVTIAPNGK